MTYGAYRVLWRSSLCKFNDVRDVATYYVVSLFGYLAKAAHDSGQLPIEPSIATAAFVPVAALAIWWTIRRIRKKRIVGED
jgi:uncharacterized membrane-anchored protein